MSSITKSIVKNKQKGNASDKVKEVGPPVIKGNASDKVKVKIKLTLGTRDPLSRENKATLVSALGNYLLMGKTD